MIDTKKIFYVNEQANKELDSLDEYIDLLQKNYADFYIFKGIDFENIKRRVRQDAINNYIDPKTDRVRLSMVDELYNYYNNKNNYITNPFTDIDTDDKK